MTPETKQKAQDRKNRIAIELAKIKICAFCGAQFNNSRPIAKYCSNVCRNYAHTYRCKDAKNSNCENHEHTKND